MTGTLPSAGDIAADLTHELGSVELIIMPVEHLLSRIPSERVLPLANAPGASRALGAKPQPCKSGETVWEKVGRKSSTSGWSRSTPESTTAMTWPAPWTWPTPARPAPAAGPTAGGKIVGRATFIDCADQPNGYGNGDWESGGAAAGAGGVQALVITGVITDVQDAIA